MVIGVVSNKDNYVDIANGLMSEGYQVMNVSNTNNMKDPEVHKRSMLHKASLCNALIVNPKSEDGFSDEIVQQAAFNNQIVIMDDMKNAEATVSHVRKEIIHA